MQRFLTVLLISLLLVTGASAQELTNQWITLLTQDGRYFDVFIGIPHTSIATLPE